MNSDHCRILVVDDHPGQRAMLTQMFCALNVKGVVEAGSGDEALRILRREKHPFDLIVTDLDMPGIDGMELARQVAAEPEPTPVALISALDERILDSLHALSSFEPGILLTVIPKPASLDSLRHAVQMLRDHGTPPTATPRSAYGLDEIISGLHLGQFVAYFEPQVALRSGDIVGFEALARWLHPQHGVIAPGAFLPQIEARPEMKQLTHAVLLSALERQAALLAEGFCGSMSINLSPHDLQDVSLAAELIRTVQHYGIEPKLVKFEVTESAATNSTAAAVENLTRLRMRGFHVSIDDFGTGYSSLQQLFRVPLTDLKIDKSFTTSMLNERVLRAAVESILQLAQRLELSTCSEGIESVDVARQLRWLGCDYGQGYLFTRPLPSPDLSSWLRHWPERRGELIEEWR